MTTTPKHLYDEYRTNEQWQTDAIEAGYAELCKLMGQEPGAVEDVGFAQLVEYSAVLFHEENPLPSDVDDFDEKCASVTPYWLAKYAIKHTTNTVLAAKIQELLDAFFAEKHELIQQFKKDKTPKEEQVSIIEKLRDDLDQNIRQNLEEHGVSYEQTIAELLIENMRINRDQFKNRYLDLLRRYAQNWHSENVTLARYEKPDVQMYEGSRGTSPLRRFVDEGGELRARNAQSREQTGIPREDEKRIDIGDGHIFVDDDE